MSLAKRYLRLSVFTGFALFALVCVSYAHSEEARVTLYTSGFSLTGGCALKVERLSDGTVLYRPVTESKTKFVGGEPMGSRMYLESARSFEREPLLLGVPILPRETLQVFFLPLPDGTLVPTGYIYDPVFMRVKSKGFTFEKNCTGLTKFRRNP